MRERERFLNWGGKSKSFPQITEANPAGNKFFFTIL